MSFCHMPVPWYAGRKLNGLNLRVFEYFLTFRFTRSLLVDYSPIVLSFFTNCLRSCTPPNHSTPNTILEIR